MKRLFLPIILLALLLSSCEEDTLDPQHPLEGQYSGELQLYDAQGNVNTAEDIKLNADQLNGDTLLLNFEDVDIEGQDLNDYMAVISNNSSMLLPTQLVNGEEHTGQGSITISGELEIIVKRLQDGSDVFMYAGSK